MSTTKKVLIALVSMVMIILISYSSYWGMQYNKAIRLIEEKSYAEAEEMHVRKNDQVMVITGKDKNTKGKITVAFPKTGKVIVEGVNMVTRHQKARNAMQPGGIVKKEAAIDASNVMLICPKCGKPTRVSHKVNVAVDANGKKNRTMVRVCKKCGADID